MYTYAHLLVASDVVLILGGATMFWFSPRLRRNWLLGYGSARSMVSDAAWQSANRFAGMMLSILALLAMSLHVSLLKSIQSSELTQMLTVGLTFLLPLLVSFLTEKYLERTFRM